MPPPAKHSQQPPQPAHTRRSHPQGIPDGLVDENGYPQEEEDDGIEDDVEDDEDDGQAAAEDDLFLDEKTIDLLEKLNNGEIDLEQFVAMGGDVGDIEKLAQLGEELGDEDDTDGDGAGDGGGADEEEEEEEENEDLKYLRQNEQFQQVLDIIRKNPRLKKPILDSYAQSNPQLYHTLVSHPGALERMLKEPPPQSTAAEQERPPLTAEDEAAIKTVCATANTHQSNGKTKTHHAVRPQITAAGSGL